MKVRILSPYPQEILVPLLNTLVSCGDIPLFPKQVTDENEVDITVMWGYRKVLRLDEIAGKRIINIHAGYLPWNRGAHPNLWSWYDDTPKGVSIHHVVEEVDAGPILAQKQIIFSEQPMTLRTTYEKLQQFAQILFQDSWPFLRNYEPKRQVMNGVGTFHTVTESIDLLRHFPQGLGTPVMDIVKFGKKQRRHVFTG